MIFEVNIRHLCLKKYVTNCWSRYKNMLEDFRKSILMSEASYYFNVFNANQEDYSTQYAKQRTAKWQFEKWLVKTLINTIRCKKTLSNSYVANFMTFVLNYFHLIKSRIPFFLFQTSVENFMHLMVLVNVIFINSIWKADDLYFLYISLFIFT